MDRVLGHDVVQGFALHWGWVQAQHDPGRGDQVAKCNAFVNSDANRAAEGDAETVRIIEESTDGNTVFVLFHNQVIVDMRKFLLCESRPLIGLRVGPDGQLRASAASQLRLWVLEGLELKGGLTVWTGIQPLTVKDWGYAHTWSLFTGVEEWEWELKDTERPECGLWCRSVKHHALYDCVFTVIRIQLWAQLLPNVLVLHSIGSGCGGGEGKY